MVKPSKKKVQLGNRSPLVKDLLVVEGISRSGKFLLANLLNGFAGIEPVQYHGILEHIPFLYGNGFLDEKVASELLRCEVDTYCYEMAIGRTLNHRRSDKSSIYNVAKPETYLKRAEGPDGDEALKLFYQGKAYSFFILHELMPNIKIYLKTFPNIKVLSLQRSPIELVLSWYKRGLARRLGADPKLFIIPFKDTSGLYPWYMHGQTKSYAKASEMDRVIMSISALIKLGKKSYAKLSVAEKKKIVFVSYEQILTEPQTITKKISTFLGRSSTGEIQNILERERLPNHESVATREAKILEIKKHASPKLFKELLVLEKNYTGYLS
jgi:hypothetical protein